VDEELTAALGAAPYERGGGRCGYRNGTKARTLTGPTGPLALAVPRARLVTPSGPQEWARPSASCGPEPWSNAAASTSCATSSVRAPKHALAEIRADCHRIVYAESGIAARVACTPFERKWSTRCPGVVRSLQEGGDELLTFFRFPKRQ
jgi:transposase-like protein